MKQLARLLLACWLIGLILGGGTLALRAALPFFNRGLPKVDLAFLGDMTRDVIQASRVQPNSNGGGRWPLTNSCGFTLITFEGGVRHVPTDLDFSKTTAWERSLSAVNTYQNGAYWHTASGWLIEALWKQDRPLALQAFGQMMDHLRAQDFRKGPGHGAPWECFGPNGQARQNPVYMASVALPYGILKCL